MAEGRTLERSQGAAVGPHLPAANGQPSPPGGEGGPVGRRSRLEITLSPGFLVLSDALAIAAGFWLAYYLRFVLEIPRAQEIHSARAYAGLLLWSTPILLASFMAHGLYERRNLRSIVDQLFRLGAAVLMGLVVAVAISSFVVRGWPEYSRLMLAYIWVGLFMSSRSSW